MHIATRAEVAAGADQHHRLHILRPLELVKQVAQLGVGIKRQRILALRTIESDGCHAILHLPLEMCGPIARQQLVIASLQRWIDCIFAHVCLQKSGSHDFATSDGYGLPGNT
ncbi:hypothetical protein SDC9_122231 [bioreactor metagenome]|uniref:Uncharacterized protein n=1 Tax=bioreactor metagenome TaxID=1076179 RepID=A0A645CE50_9ZZZZ